LIDPFGSLQTLAEVSIAVVGFTGIVAVYQRVNDAQSELARWRVYTVLTSSLIALFFSTVPVGIAQLGVPEPELWRLCSGALVLGYLGFYADLLRTRKRLSPTSLAPIAAHPWYSRILTSVSFALVGLLALNASAALFIPRTGLYYFGVLWIIATSCTIFGRTVFGPQASGSSPAA